LGEYLLIDHDRNTAFSLIAEAVHASTLYVENAGETAVIHLHYKREV
jgi:hypothetical protein